MLAPRSISTSINAHHSESVVIHLLESQYVEPLDMLAELREDNEALTARLRETHNLCDEHRDVASASLIEQWIDEAERRTWFLFEASRLPDSGGH
jgi:starvation-inducible DNA-binding protein